jgi:hypothetical protein
LSVFPGYYRRQVLVPNSKWESGFHPWEASADLRYFSYRYELEWKDQVYCEVSFSEMGENSRLVRSEFVNRTAQPQNLVLHYMASLNFPPLRTYSDEVVRPCSAFLPEQALWLDSLDYVDLKFAVPRPQDSLVYDGLWRAEVRGHGFVNATGVGSGFGRDQGDRVEYTLRLPETIAQAVLLIRYRASQGTARFTCEGVACGELNLPESQDFTLAQVRFGDLSAGEYRLGLVSQGGAAVTG